MLGHLSYYAITDNLERCTDYVHRATEILYKWLNRKSQRKAYTWANFKQALAWVEWPKPRLRKDLNPCRRAEASRMTHRGAGCMGKPLVRFREGQEIQPGYGRDIVAPSRKQVATEKTNFFLQSRKAPVYSKDQTVVFSFLF